MVLFSPVFLLGVCFDMNIIELYNNKINGVLSSFDRIILFIPYVSFYSILFLILLSFLISILLQSSRLILYVYILTLMPMTVVLILLIYLLLKLIKMNLLVPLLTKILLEPVWLLLFHLLSFVVPWLLFPIIKL